MAKQNVCKWCGDTRHFSFQCYQHPKKVKETLKHPPLIAPKKPTPIKRTAPIKVRKPIKQKPMDPKWAATRKLFFSITPPDHAGYYYCKIVPCLLPGVPMLKAEVQLDHIKPKSTYPQFKYSLWNLRESHGLCNNEKGSMSDEAYQCKWTPEKLQRYFAARA